MSGKTLNQDPLQIPIKEVLKQNAQDYANARKDRPVEGFEYLLQADKPKTRKINILGIKIKYYNNN